MVKSLFAKHNKLSVAQENILINIQHATYEKDIDFLNCLPEEVKQQAEDAQRFYAEEGVSESAIDADKNLCKLVKKYWAKNGLAISQ